MAKVIFLCGESLTVFQKKVVESIINEPKITIPAVLIDARPRPSFYKRFKKNLKRGRGGYMLIMLFNHLRENKEPTISTKEFFSRVGIRCIETTRPFSQETVDMLAPYKTDILVLIGGFGIIKEPLLSAVDGGILSYHHGDMRKYRGQPPGFWELYNGETEMGVTVQRLAAGIDNGIPVVEMKIPILNTDNETSLYNRAREKSVEMMLQAILSIQAPDYQPKTIEKFGKVYTLPNLKQYLSLKRRLKRRSNLEI